MKPILICLFSLLFLVLGACNYQSAYAPTAQPLPGRAQVDTATPHLVTTAILGVFSDSSVQIITETATPWPTYTATASNTPIPSTTPTNTPLPTITPTATATVTNTPPVVTATDTPQPTPTMEPTIDPITPEPTLPPPDEASCFGNTLVNLNYRDQPAITGNRIGMWNAGQRLRVIEVQFVQDGTYVNEWALLTNGAVQGWSAAYYRGFVNFTRENSQPCADVWFPEPVVKQGGHIIAANGANTLLNHCAEMTTVKLFHDMVHYAAAFRACNPDIWILCRYWTDDLARESDYDAEVAYQRIGRAFPSECNAVEPENEKAPPDDNLRDWGRWSRFSIDFATLMAVNRNMQSCAFSFGPGWPTLERLVYIIDYLRWVHENPLPDGRYHCVASHAALYAPWSRSDMPWVNNFWLAGYMYRIRDWIYNNTPDHFDLFKWRGVWVVSEAGLSDGYAGNWDAEYSCQELASAFWKTVSVYQENGFPDVLQLWSFGAAGNWTDDSYCASTIWTLRRHVRRLKLGG